MVGGMTLHPYQRRCATWLLDHDEALLLLGMGMGKSAIVLTALSDLQVLGGLDGPVLVIAPLAVAGTTWPEEAALWAPSLRVSLVLGDVAARRRALAEDADVYVINRENTCWLVDEMDGSWPFRTVVVDELSGFKSPTAKRFRALRRLRPEMRRVWGLTGTPAPNGLEDLWAQVCLVDGGERLGRTVTGYRERYLVPGARNGHVVYRWVPRRGAAERIGERISDISVSMRPGDWLDLPPVVEDDVPAVLSGAQLRAYRRFERERVAELDGRDVTAVSAGVVAGKLAQWADGAVYDDTGSWHEVHRAKLDALRRIVDEAQGAPVLVFYAYRHDAERIIGAFPQASVLHAGDAGMVAAWNRGEVPVMLAHPAGCGYGLNLQRGGHICAWFGLTWDLAAYQQACARLHRQGQGCPVEVHRIVARGTVDERILRVLAGKASLQDEVLRMRDGKP